MKKLLGLALFLLVSAQPIYAQTMEDFIQRGDGLAKSADGDKIRAAAYYQKALEMAQLAKDVRQQAYLLFTLGSLYVDNRQFEKAKETLGQGIEFANQSLPPLNPMRGLFYIRLSTVYMYEQNFDKATPILDQGIGILEQQMKAGGPSLASLGKTIEPLKTLSKLLTSFNVGLKALQTWEYPKAEENFKEALKISIPMGDSTLTSVSYSSLGMACIMEDKYPEAEAYLNQAIQLSESSHLAEAKLAALTGLGMLNSRLGKLEQSKTYYQQALAFDTPIFDHAHVKKEIFAQEIARLDHVQAEINKASAPPNAENFVKDAPINGQLVRWNDGTQTVKVYVTPGSQIQDWKDAYTDRVKQAFSEWELALQGRLHFEFAQNPEEADTIIHWSGDYNNRESGLTVYKYVGNTLVQNDVIFYLKRCDNKLYDDETVHRIALHEIGHLLGIHGHSKSIQDIMYPSVSMAKALSLRDIATARELYRLKPDISNPADTSLSQYRANHHIAPISLSDALLLAN